MRHSLRPKKRFPVAGVCGVLAAVAFFAGLGLVLLHLVQGCE